MSQREISRRELVAGFGGGLIVAGCAGAVKRAGADADEGEGEDVTPAQDLMREHGVLERILGIYEEGARRLEAGAAFDPAPVARAAAIVKRFIEDYHEHLEEQFLFPRFEAKGVLVPLVAVLRAQHAAGRALTARIAAGATAADLRAFARMYRPHHAREDTVLFVALPQVIGAKELKELGEQFEDEEHRRFGKPGFEGVVAEVDALEQALGIEDLARFTPTT